MSLNMKKPLAIAAVLFMSLIGAAPASAAQHAGTPYSRPAFRQGTSTKRMPDGCTTKWNWRVEQNPPAGQRYWSEVEWVISCGYAIQDRSTCAYRSTWHTYSGIVTALYKWDRATCQTGRIAAAAAHRRGGAGWSTYQQYWP